MTADTDHAFACLQTGAEQLRELLEGRSDDIESTIQLWMNKVVAAGMEPEQASMFVVMRLAAEIECIRARTPLSEYLGRILMAFSALKQQGFWAGIASVTLSSALAEIPDGCSYAVMHCQDLEDLEDRGSCCVAFGTTDVDGNAVSDEERAEAGKALADALMDEGLSVDWDGDPARRIRIDGIAGEEK